MAIFQINNIEVIGIAASVPKATVYTSDYDYITEQERKLFVSGTGIKERRVAHENMCTSDMCFSAAQQLLKDTNINSEDIDILIFVSQSPDYFLPATSILLQDRLGLKKSTIAFDVNLGCSGYVYGLAIIANLLNMVGSNALLLCGDKSTYSTTPTDKSTYPLFGDAGTATLLSKNTKAKPLYFNLQTDGSGWESIIIRGGGTRNRYKEGILDKKIIEPGIERNLCNLELDGVEVFNFSLREVKPNVMELLDFSNIELENIDFVVMHQANRLMNESVRKKLKVDKEKVPYSIEKFGNTSSASIPLTMVTELHETLKNKSNQLLLSGFGVGFSWGSVILTTNNIIVSELLEIE